MQIKTSIPILIRLPGQPPSCQASISITLTFEENRAAFELIPGHLSSIPLSHELAHLALYRRWTLINADVAVGSSVLCLFASQNSKEEYKQLLKAALYKRANPIIPLHVVDSLHFDSIIQRQFVINEANVMKPYWNFYRLNVKVNNAFTEYALSFPEIIRAACIKAFGIPFNPVFIEPNVVDIDLDESFKESFWATKNDIYALSKVLTMPHDIFKAQ